MDQSSIQGKIVTLKDGRVCQIIKRIHVFDDKQILRRYYRVIQSYDGEEAYRFVLHTPEVIRPSEIERIGE